MSLWHLVKSVIFPDQTGIFTSWTLAREGAMSVVGILIAVLILEAVIFELVLPGLLKTPAVVRYTTILLLLLPSGFLMGIPFPLAMRDLVNLPVQRAYAWSVNGCASVLTAIAAAQVAISWGIAHVAAAGIISYGIAAVVVGKRLRL